ncbi:hypothetical protein HK104_001298 [Borealophlyctis nickersoniae]|nr:hypothetical protein HK104_001298 [Borealophlyctis nickersoniae]
MSVAQTTRTIPQVSLEGLQVDRGERRHQAIKKATKVGNVQLVKSGKKGHPPSNQATHFKTEIGLWLDPHIKAEYASEERIAKLIKSCMVSPKDVALLKDYLKQRKPGERNIFLVPYTYRQIDRFGRLYVDPDKKAVGHQKLSKNVRKYITAGYYIDIDVVNCQPTIIIHLFKQLKIDLPPDLKRLVEERAAVLQENGITDKRVVNKYLNRSSTRGIPHPFLERIHRAIYEILIPRLKESPQFKPLWDWVQVEKKYNKEGSFLSYVVQTVENNMLAVMHGFFVEHGFQPDSLIFDGMFVKKDDAIGGELLRECERFIKTQVGIDLRLAIKPMECTVDYETDISLENGGITLDDDKELSRLLHEATNGTSGRIAYLTMHLMKDRYMCKHRQQWYKFVGHRWRETSGAPAMDAMATLTSAFGRWYGALLSALEEKACHETDMDRKEAITRNIQRIEKERDALIMKIEDSAFRSRIMKDVEDLMDEHTREIVFDAEPFLLCFENGVYDLQQDTLRPGRPTDFLKLGVPYALPEEMDPDIDGALDRLLESIFPSGELLDYVMLTLCTGLEGINRHEQYWTWQGSGRNGKGLLKDLILEVLGEELCKVPKPTILTTKRCQSSQANPEFIDLKGARVVFCSEPCEGEKIKSATLREITGNDRTRQRGLYGSQETIRPDFSLFLLCNSRPTMDAPNTDAIWDRERSVHFRRKFVDNPRLPEERLIDRGLKSRLKAYAPYFMKKLLRKYAEFRDSGYRLDPPSEVLQTSREYQMENNPVEKFFHEQIFPVVSSQKLDMIAKDSEVEKRKLEEAGRGKESARKQADEHPEVILPVNRLWSVFQMWSKDSLISLGTTENGFYQKLSDLSKNTYPKVRRAITDPNTAKTTKSFCYVNMGVRDYDWNDDGMCWELHIPTDER